MIRLQVQFAVNEGDRATFEEMYETVYLPALRQQTGFIGSSLLRAYPADLLEELGFGATQFDYQLELEFDTEANRDRWAQSVDHQEPWRQATSLSQAVQACGYEVVATEK